MNVAFVLKHRLLRLDVNEKMENIGENHALMT